MGQEKKAIVRAREAVKLMPNNSVLRFTYAQTLFAGEQYPAAAIAVRSTLEKMAATGKQDVFYPMKLYPDEATLNGQIDKLIAAINAQPARANLKLLLGYELLGVGRVDEAIKYLQDAAQDRVNEKAAIYLTKISSRMYRNIEIEQKENNSNKDIEPQTPKSEPNY